MRQKRIHSLTESITNVGVGFGIALASQLLIFPLYGIAVPLSTNIYITLWFTLISIIRSYIIRRYFTTRKVLA